MKERSHGGFVPRVGHLISHGGYALPTYIDLDGAGRRDSGYRPPLHHQLHQPNHQIKQKEASSAGAAGAAACILEAGVNDVVDAAERFRCRPLLRLERGSGGPGADGGRRQRQRRTSNSLAIAPPLEEKLQRAEFPPHSPRLCAQENPDDFDSGPLYLLTQAVKGNEQVRGRCSSLLRAPARREAAPPVPALTNAPPALCRC